MTIINMAGGGGNNINVPLNGISDLTASSGDGQSVIKRTDVGDLVVNGVTVNEWSCTKLVRKTGSAPASSNDGTPVLTETLENSYSVTGYTNTGLTNDTTYYYGAFSVGTNGLETISNIATVTPSAGGWQPGANTIAYYKCDGNLNDSSSNHRDLSIYSGTPTYGTESGGGKYIYLSNTCWTTYWSDSIAYELTTLSFWKKNPVDVAKPCIEIWNPNMYVRVEGRTNMNYRCSSNLVSSDDSGWHYYCMVTNSTSSVSLYVDGTLITTGTAVSTGTNTVRFRFNQYGDTDSASNCNEVYLSEVIFESKERTAQEIADYYDQTKGDYGL